MEKDIFTTQMERLLILIYKLLVINSCFPTNATRLRAFGTIVTNPHLNNNTKSPQLNTLIAPLPIQTNNYRIPSHSQYLQARTSKARVRAKVRICDELDIMDDKLYTYSNTNH